MTNAAQPFSKTIKGAHVMILLFPLAALPDLPLKINRTKTFLNV
ncbi:hypothetical protein WKQ99_15950 [Pseudomonas atacamensis]